MLPGTQTVHIVDSDRHHRQTLSALLTPARAKVCTYESAEDFLDQFQNPRPACLILGLRLPGISGLELLERLSQRCLALPSIVVTADADIPTTIRAIKLGAVDLLEKPVDSQVLVPLVERVLAEDARRLVDIARIQDARRRLEALSDRERELFGQLSQGLTYKEIARNLGISARTVEHHRARIGRKLNLDRVTDFVRLEIRATSAVP